MWVLLCFVPEGVSAKEFQRTKDVQRGSNPAEIGCVVLSVSVCGLKVCVRERGMRSLPLAALSATKRETVESESIISRVRVVGSCRTGQTEREKVQERGKKAVVVSSRRRPQQIDSKWNSHNSSSSSSHGIQLFKDCDFQSLRRRRTKTPARN